MQGNACLYSTIGNVIQRVPLAGQDSQIDLTKVAPGVYGIVVETQDGQHFSRRLVVIR